MVACWASTRSLDLLRLRRNDLSHYDFAMIFATPLNSLIDRAMRDPHSLIALDTRSGERLYATLRGVLPRRLDVPSPPSRAADEVAKRPHSGGARVKSASTT